MAREAREKPLSVNEREFLLQALREEKRVDGRALNDMRMLKISVGPAPGEVTVLLGQTRVYCVVSAELSEPRPERPTEGFFHFNTEFSPMASPAFEPGRPPESAIELGRIVERGLRESKAIDSEALCIVAGVKVWSVHINLFILDHNGNLIDCASIAAVTALLHFKRPEVAINGNEVTVYSSADREPVSLSIHHIPIAITFALFDGGSIIAVDPSLKEELAMEGRITMTLTVLREICAVQKAGGTPLTVAQIMKCAKIAATKAAEVTKAIQSATETSKERKVVTKTIDLSSIVPQATTLLRPQETVGKDKGEKKKAKNAPQIFTSEETYFQGSASAWAVKEDGGVSALTPEEQSKLSQQASNFLSELAVNLNRTQATSDDVEMTEASAASPAAAPPTAEVPKKKPSSKKAAIDSEEETVKAVVAMDEVQAPPKKSKGNEAASTASPAPAPRAPSATEGGDLAMALKKKPKKAGAAATK